MTVMSTSELPPPTVEIVDEALIASGFMDDEAPEQTPMLSLAVAGTMEVPATGDRPPLLMLFMADGTVRWVNQPTGGS
jgi:hypothetical protein